MASRDWFEYIRSRVLELRAMESRLDELRAKAGPRGQRFDATGHGGHAHDASAPILSIAETEAELDSIRKATNAEIERALLVLYGKSGRGGIAKAKGSAYADCICGYYLMGMSWREVAEDLAVDSVDGRQWCWRHAYRGFEFIDTVGLSAITES